MFRKGGSAGEGITSGLAPRQGYQGTGNAADQSVQPFDLRNANMDQIDAEVKRRSLQLPPMAPDNSLRDFKIDFGLDLVSRTPGGNIFQTAGAAAKEPFNRFRQSKAAYNKGVQDRAINKYNSESDMFSTLLGAQAKILGSEGASKSYEKIELAKKVRQLLPRFLELKDKRKDIATGGEELTNEEILELRQLQEDYNAYRKADPGEELLMDIFVKGQGDRYFTRKMEELFKADIRLGANRKYKGEKYTDDPQVKRDAIQAIKTELEELTYADGGRAGYANGEMVEEQITETETMAPGPMDDGSNNLISYDQLRARLPAEITDDIVELMTNSAEALEDFAMISTQADVDQFNRKYSVNLVLPAEA